MPPKLYPKLQLQGTPHLQKNGGSLLSRTVAAQLSSEVHADQIVAEGVVVNDSQVSQSEALHAKRPILSGGGGGIFFFWQLGASPLLLLQQDLQNSLRPHLIAVLACCGQLQVSMISTVLFILANWSLGAQICRTPLWSSQL